MAKENVIKFVSDIKVLEEFWPRPIGRDLPEWFKKMPAYGGYDGAAAEEKRISQQDASYNSTIKGCVPVFDSITLGYTIYTDIDIYVKINPKKDHNDQNEQTDLQFTWRPDALPSGLKLVEGHQFGQAEFHPLAKNFPGRDVFKYVNPWHIITPPGYSTLFMSPMNNPNGFFEALPGVVDTDSYTNVVNFPFVMQAKEIETIIPAGTPIVQVFPFKRESWIMKTQATEKDWETINQKDRIS